MKQSFVCMRLKFNINFREEIHTYMKLKKHAKYLCMKKCILFDYFYCFSWGYVFFHKDLMTIFKNNEIYIFLLNVKIKNINN